MGTKNLKLGIVAEPTISGGNVTITVTGGDQTQTFSLAKSGNITIPTSLEDAQYFEIPVTAEDYLYISNYTFVSQQFITKNIGITVSGGTVGVAYWGTNYRRTGNTPSSTGVLYDNSIIVDTPLFDGQPDPSRMSVSKSLVGNVYVFTEGVGTAIINDGETFTANVDIDYYVPVQ